MVATRGPEQAAAWINLFPGTSFQATEMCHRYLVISASVLCFVLTAFPATNPQDADIYQLIVRIRPDDIGRRSRDERPAEFRLTAADFAAGRRLDLASLQVQRWDTA